MSVRFFCIWDWSKKRRFVVPIILVFSKKLAIFVDVLKSCKQLNDLDKKIHSAAAVDPARGLCEYELL